jgi:hypothetical protein
MAKIHQSWTLIFEKKNCKKVPRLRTIFIKPNLKIVEEKLASSVNCKIEF